MQTNAPQTIPEVSTAVNFSESDLKRFWAKVDKSPIGCWIWTAAKLTGGHGYFRFMGKMVRAHRVSWLIHNGEIPPGKCVLHNCPGGDNPACVNPDHLWLGTQLENIEDARVKGQVQSGDNHHSRRHPENVQRGDNHHSRRNPETISHGSCHKLAKLTEEKVMSIRSKYSTGLFTQKQLAAENGVSKGLITNVVLRKCWKHI